SVPARGRDQSDEARPAVRAGSIPGATTRAHPAAARPRPFQPDPIAALCPRVDWPAGIPLLAIELRPVDRAILDLPSTPPPCGAARPIRRNLRRSMVRELLPQPVPLHRIPARVLQGFAGLLRRPPRRPGRRDFRR